MLFDTLMVSEIKIKGYAMSNFNLYEDGKICTVGISKKIMDEIGCVYEDVECLSGFPRSINGVEVGLLIKEWKDGIYKISIRTNSYVDSTVLASKFGGGGHIRASGCTIEGNLESVTEKIVNAAKELI
jgi:phosphoesterase RecJ-like protein